MLILIEKDSATKIPKEVTPEQAADFAKDFTVEVVGEDGATMPYAEWLNSAEVDPEAIAQAKEAEAHRLQDEQAKADADAAAAEEERLAAEAEAARIAALNHPEE